MTQPANKQEALDQIDSLRAYIEDLDKPKRVRVYIKEDALNNDPRFMTMCVDTDGMRDMVGGVFDWRSGSGNDDTHLSIFNADKDDYWAFRKDQCVIVEGEIPPNDTKEA